MNEKFNLKSACGCAFKGIFATAAERNFKIELCFGALVIILGFALSISPLEWLAVIICIGLVLGGEAFNSAVEAIVDLASPGYHELAGKAKDCAAGGVHLFSLGALAVGIVIFLPKLLALIGV